VGAGGVGVCARYSHYSDGIAEVDERHYSINRVNFLLDKPHDVHLLQGALPDEELLPIVQEIVELPAIDLVKGDPYLQALVLLLYVLEDVVHR